MRKIGFRFILSVITIFFLSFCDNQNPIHSIDHNLTNGNSVANEFSNNKFASWNHIQEIAEGFALCFNDASFKTILHSSITNSIYPENKVDFKKLSKGT